MCELVDLCSLDLEKKMVRGSFKNYLKELELSVPSSLMISSNLLFAVPLNVGPITYVGAYPTSERVSMLFWL